MAYIYIAYIDAAPGTCGRPAVPLCDVCFLGAPNFHATLRIVVDNFYIVDVIRLMMVDIPENIGFMVSYSHFLTAKKIKFSKFT